MGDAMVEVIKFARRETAFAPETIEILAAALDEAWERLEKSGSRLARPAYSRVMREVVAKRIVEMAQRGVQDRVTLVEDALHFVAANYGQSSIPVK
jgi:2-polyprenyl-6-methoxyphenol hydroxylase-like FAD-dependent oxidoreductase